MASYRMLRRVVLVRTDVSEELSASIIRVTRIGELGTLAVTINQRSSDMSVLSRATRRNIPEDGILHSHRSGNLRSVIVLTVWTLAETCCVSCEVRTGFLYSRRRHSS
jgi:hypothetical protein